MHLAATLNVAHTTVPEKWTAEGVHKFLDQAVAATKLTPFGERQLVDQPERVIFCQLIAESHIAGHLERGHAIGWLDVFSCKDINVGLVIEAVREHLSLPGDHWTVTMLDRGKLPQ